MCDIWQVRLHYVVDTHTHTHTRMCILIFVKVNWQHKLARKIQHKKRSGWDSMNSFICNRIYAFWCTQTCTETAQSAAFAVCGCCNAHLWFLIKFQGADSRWWASFGFFTPCSDVFCCVPVCQNAEDDQMTFILISEYGCFCVHVIFVLSS